MVRERNIFMPFHVNYKLGNSTKISCYIDGSHMQIPSDCVDISIPFDVREFVIDGVPVEYLLTMGNFESTVMTASAQPINSVQTEGSTEIEDSITLEWCDTSSKLLISLFDVNNLLLKQRKIKNKTAMFAKITKEMNQSGFQFTIEQVWNKFKSLERAFKKVIDNNNKSGRGRKSCPYERYVNKW